MTTRGPRAAALQRRGDEHLQASQAPCDAISLRCILQLPDGTELVISPGGQEVRRAWLIESLRLHNPAAYQREIALMAERRSTYSYVSNRDAHCALWVRRPDTWVISTTRADVWTEYSFGAEFDRLQPDTPVPLASGMRVRLGGRSGLALIVLLI